MVAGKVATCSGPPRTQQGVSGGQAVAGLSLEQKVLHGEVISE